MVTRYTTRNPTGSEGKTSYMTKMAFQTKNAFQTETFQFYIAVFSTKKVNNEIQSDFSVKILVFNQNCLIVLQY